MGAGGKVGKVVVMTCCLATNDADRGQGQGGEERLDLLTEERQRESNEERGGSAAASLIADIGIGIAADPISVPIR